VSGTAMSAAARKGLANEAMDQQNSTPAASQNRTENHHFSEVVGVRPIMLSTDSAKEAS
jgi:hypothetical protein